MAGPSGTLPRNIAWAEVGVLAGIMLVLVGVSSGVGFPLLIAHINGVETSLNNRITDLNISLSARLDSFPEVGGISPFPVPADVAAEHKVQIPKSRLEKAAAGEEIVSLGKGDYVVLPIEFELGETKAIRWQAVGFPGENAIDFYLLGPEGKVHRFSRTADYSSVWMAPTKDTYYLYFSNLFDRDRDKALWIQLADPRGEVDS